MDADPRRALPTLCRFGVTRMHNIYRVHTQKNAANRRPFAAAANRVNSSVVPSTGMLCDLGGKPLKIQRSAVRTAASLWQSYGLRGSVATRLVVGLSKLGCGWSEAPLSASPGRPDIGKHGEDRRPRRTPLPGPDRCGAFFTAQSIVDITVHVDIGGEL